jgi:hypothetical protein
MSRVKTILVLVFILGLGGLCAFLNRDWFAKSHIQISYRVSPWLAVRGKGDLGVPVVFSLDRYYRLKEIKVFKAEEIATNKYAHAIWELTSKSNSIPTASFAYGEKIEGMKFTSPDAVTDALEPYVMYRLVIKTANDDEAQHDFTTTPLPQTSERAAK